MLLTGLHTVRDAFCTGCRTRVGWKYGAWARGRWRCLAVAAVRPLTRLARPAPVRAEQAFEASQRYKVGCYILESTRVYEDTGDALARPQPVCARVGVAADWRAARAGP